MSTTVFGVFHDRDRADEAVHKLQALGYRQDEINILMSGSTHARHFGSTAEGASVGAGIGGAIGAIVAGLTATGAIVATGGLAAPIVVGPFAAVLAGLGAGGVAGGIIGTLVGAGIPEEQARHYGREVERGAIVVATEARPENLSAVKTVLQGDQGTQGAPPTMRSTYPPESVEERADQVIKSRGNPID